MDKILEISEERYSQIQETYGNKLTEEDVCEIVDEWTPEIINRGYDILEFDSTGMLEVEVVNEIASEERNDEWAVNQAIKDGIKIIPIDELPKKFNKKYLGWIDTPENRAAIEEYTAKFCA